MNHRGVSHSDVSGVTAAADPMGHGSHYAGACKSAESCMTSECRYENLPGKLLEDGEIIQ